ncbi:MAG: DUF6478 family protein [Pseudomonadota bacterium]
MPKNSNSFLDKALRHHSAKVWSRIAGKAASLDPNAQRELRTDARAMLGQLNTLLSSLDERHRIRGLAKLPEPHNADLSWRPEVWRGTLTTRGLSSVSPNTQFGRDLTVFHDCPLSEITLRQVNSSKPEDTAPYGLRMDVFRFGGSFLSLALSLPPDAVENLSKSHLFRMAVTIDLERPLEIFARLNVRHGPNTEQIVQELAMTGGELSAEFDLAYSKLNESRVENAWIDLIFEGPEMNQITVRDLAVWRSPRAEV